MHDATSELYLAFLVEEEGTHGQFPGLARGDRRARAVLRALYRSRRPLLPHPAAGEPVDRDQVTLLGRALGQLGIEHIPAYSPEARGRSERLFGTLQDRLPKELRLAGIADLDAANRFLAEVYLPGRQSLSALARGDEVDLLGCQVTTGDELNRVKRFTSHHRTATIWRRGKWNKLLVRHWELLLHC